MAAKVSTLCAHTGPTSFHKAGAVQSHRVAHVRKPGARVNTSDGKLPTAGRNYKRIEILTYQWTGTPTFGRPPGEASSASSRSEWELVLAVSLPNCGVHGDQRRGVVAGTVSLRDEHHVGMLRGFSEPPDDQFQRFHSPGIRC
jgi:hypothetical protein